MEGWSFVTLATVQLSTVVGVPRSTPVAVQPLLVVAATSAGQVIVGFTLSVTVTVKLFWGDPQLFVAVMVTFVVPVLKVLPEPVPVPLPVVAPVKVYETEGVGVPDTDNG